MDVIKKSLEFLALVSNLQETVMKDLKKVSLFEYSTGLPKALIGLEPTFLYN